MEIEDGLAERVVYDYELRLGDGVRNGHCRLTKTCEDSDSMVMAPATEVYADGACRGNPGPGAWAAIVRTANGEERELVGFDASTTNNRMELSAAIAGLSATPRGGRVRVTTDSRYVVDGMTQWVPGWIQRGWRKADRSPVLNRELWQRLVAEAALRQVEWIWVQGHAGHAENERCDELANKEMDRRGY